VATKQMNTEKIGEQLTKKLVDDGKVIEGGWVGFVLACKLEDAPQHQLDDMRRAFFGGAMHLFSSILSFLEDGHEPTDKDMDRMSAVSDELVRFQKEFEALTKGQN
jgi:hypothetical protein